MAECGLVKRRGSAPTPCFQRLGWWGLVVVASVVEASAVVASVEEGAGESLRFEEMQRLFMI